MGRLSFGGTTMRLLSRGDFAGDFLLGGLVRGRVRCEGTSGAGEGEMVPGSNACVAVRPFLRSATVMTSVGGGSSRPRDISAITFGPVPGDEVFAVDEIVALSLADILSRLLGELSDDFEFY